MLETTLRDYLMDQLDIPVYLEKPADKPSLYVVLRRIDSGMINQVAAATFSFKCIAETLYEAAQLSTQVKEALLESIELSVISSAKLGGENGRVDASERGYEYELIFNFYYYEEV